ncbi:hypothetical protein NF681_11540 [Comamonadaceae bacterium OTU4NAUVB1]|nr:hypothetical protein NF681_11540 [Comamonadaceae bacterium OTU4NAUVB1]
MSQIRSPEPFWRTTGVKTPWGPFDPDARLNFSFDVSPWVTSAGVGLALADCEVLTDQKLQASREIDGQIITVRMQAAAGQTLVPETYLSFRLRMTLSDGQRDDRTFWLLVRER